MWKFVVVALVATFTVSGFAQEVTYECPGTDIIDMSAVCADKRMVGLREYVTYQHFFYSNTWAPDMAGYWHLGEFARVARDQIPGTIPLTRYYGAASGNGYGTELSSAPNVGTPYTDATQYKTAYIYKERVPGTFGLYRFEKGGFNRFALEDTKDEVENLGFRETGLLGYVYKPCPFNLGEWA